MIPKKVLEKGKALAKGATIYGIPLESLSREDAIAIAALGWKSHQDQLTESIRRRKL